MRAAKKMMKREAGIALLTTLLLLLLMSSLLVGFFLLISEGQKLGTMNNDYSKAFYASEAGMEKITADLGTLFDLNYSPSGAQVLALQNAPPVINGVNFLNADGTNGFSIKFNPNANGDPAASNATVTSGPYQGMVALTTPYTLTVTARTANGSEVKLRRFTQTIGIPMFQFGMFCDYDCDFFPGPVFNFGGRTHTNGNLFLADGNNLVLAGRVTAFKDVIRTNLENGWPATTNYNGTVNITAGSGALRPLAMNEGSLVGTVGTAVNPNWTNISLGATNYAGNLRNGATGAHNLQLGIVTLGAGSTQPVDVLRRPLQGESGLITNERYFAQASFRVLLSDNPTDIMSLPCVDTSTQPFNLQDIASDPNAGGWTTGSAPALKTAMNTNYTNGLSTKPIPMATSGAAAGATVYNPTNGYWLPQNTPIEPGFIKIEVQTAYGNPCGAWRDVTIEVLALGYAGKNIHPVGGAVGPNLPQISDENLDNPKVPAYTQVRTFGGQALMPAAYPYGTSPNCWEPHPNAVIRLERIRDNPSAGGACAVTKIVNQYQPLTTSPSDYWPNVLFDPREGSLRDLRPSQTTGVGAGPTIVYSRMVPLSGVFHYVEIDARNLATYLAGGFAGTNGHLAFDPVTAPNDYAVYVSDRRGNYTVSQNWTGGSTWPPLSPAGHETGEYGWNDYVNFGSSPLAGCPNGTLDAGEDIDGTNTLYLYGGDPTHAMSARNVTGSPWLGGYGYYSQGLPGNLYGNATTNALTTNPACPAVTSLWPFTMVIHANEVRENPNFFFRRAVKIVDGDVLNLGVCPGAVVCGLTIAAENPIYLEGDYNSNSAGNGFNDPHVATSVVGDSVTLLSNNWNDYNSFYTPYNMSGPNLPIQAGQPNTAGLRGAVTTFYRTAVMGGKTLYFQNPAGTISADYGTDGGVHNFLRYIETWGGQTLNYRGSIVSLFFSRQAMGTFKCCAMVYSPPTRGYNFDVEFLQPQLLPPRTPLFRDINTTGFSQLLLPNQQ